jgi:hypothetical protein
LARAAPAGFFLEIDIRQRSAAVVADDESGVEFSCGLSTALSLKASDTFSNFIRLA